MRLGLINFIVICGLPLGIAFAAEAAPTVISKGCRTYYEQALVYRMKHQANHESMKQLIERTAALYEQEPDCTLALVVQADAVRSVSYINYNNHDASLLDVSRQLLDRALKEHPNLPEALLSYAWQALAKGDESTALSYIQQVEEIGGIPPERVARIKSRSLRSLGRFDEALKALEPSLRKDAVPAVDYTFAVSERTGIYKKMKRYVEAEASYRESIALEPDDAWNYGNFASFLSWQKRYDEAIEMAERALQIMDYGMGRKILADALSGKAGQAYRKAWDNRANHSLRDQQIALARRSAERCLQVLPNHEACQKMMRDTERR